MIAPPSIRICIFRTGNIQKIRNKKMHFIDDIGMFNAVYLYDDHLLLAFNPREGTVKVPFLLINGSDTSGYGPPKNPPEMADFYCILHKSDSLLALLLEVIFSYSPPLRSHRRDYWFEYSIDRQKSARNGGFFYCSSRL